MSNPVKGTDIMLYYHDVGTDTDIAFACAKNCALTITPTFKDVTDYTSAFFKKVKPDIAEWSVSVDGLIILQNYSYLFMTDLQQSRESILIKFVVDNGADGLVIYAGSVYIGGITLTGNFNEAGMYSTTLIGTGAYNSTGTQITPTGILVQGGVPTRFEGTSASESTSIVIASTIGASTILEFNRGGSNTTQIIYAGTPTGQQIKFDTTTGTFSTATDNPFAAGEEVSGDFV